jgi:ubiquinone/menaquinone biosynthesis C-methylase UbiE
MFLIVKLALCALLILWVFRQVRKPTGLIGERVVRAMNQAHAAMTDWGLTQVPIGKGDTILDVGCGGGRTVGRLAALAGEGSVDGIDYSAASVAASQKMNAREIQEGRVSIQLASVAALPFPDRTFDLVTAVETHYYWPDLPANLREVLRVLKPGGTFALIAETHRDGWRGALYSVPMWLVRAAHLSDAEHRDLLAQSGFAEVSTRHLPGRNWICALGRRPQAAEPSH